MLSIHTDEPQTDFAATRQTAARCIGVHDNEVTDDDSPHPRFFLGVAWALGISAVICAGVVMVVG